MKRYENRQVVLMERIHGSEREMIVGPIYEAYCTELHPSEREVAAGSMQACLAAIRLLEGSCEQAGQSLPVL